MRSRNLGGNHLGDRLGSRLLSLACALAVIGLAWLGRTAFGEKPEAHDWVEVQPGLLRSAGLPSGYALLDGDKALLIDAPHGANFDALKNRGIKKIELVLLTHHHRDTCARAGELLEAGVPVRAPKAALEWLLPEPVARYWQASLPLRDSRTAYLVVPVGFKGLDCSLEDGQPVAQPVAQKIDWRGWTLQVIGTPGHSRDHVAFAARKGRGPAILFCGDAFASPGKMWSPYTTDWDHWTDAGLKPAAESLRKLAALKPDLLCPAHGEPIKNGTVNALIKTAEAVEEAGFLKSFERFSKQRLGNPPKYEFLAKEQAGSNGSLPWSQLSPHLFYTGNTYVLASKEGAVMVFDPWGKRSVDRIQELLKERKLGPIELVMFSHAHYDHYDGVYDLPDRDRFKVWSLGEVAKPIGEPLFYRAPFVDVRPVRFDRRLKDGESAAWREYTFRFHHAPGQTYFTMGVETIIDGKKCYFTADNFFHVDLYSGTGGWMGLNRSSPALYAASAQKVLDVKPDWILAEHGGACEFDAEDFRRRVQWGLAAAKACDSLSPSGNHHRDWDPHRVHVEPLVITAKPGAEIKVELVIANPLDRPEAVTVQLDGRGLVSNWERSITVARNHVERAPVALSLSATIQPGRHIFPLRIRENGVEDASDAFLAVDVAP